MLCDYFRPHFAQDQYWQRFDLRLMMEQAAFSSTLRLSEMLLGFGRRVDEQCATPADERFGCSSPDLLRRHRWLLRLLHPDERSYYGTEKGKKGEYVIESIVWPSWLAMKYGIDGWRRHTCHSIIVSANKNTTALIASWHLATGVTGRRQPMICLLSWLSLELGDEVHHGNRL